MKLPKVYEPSEYESDIYALWEKNQAFTPKGEGESFSIVVPPPNANGNLHLGHGLTLALEDSTTRYQRMQGKDALLLPGADHAGFETQVVYEKLLAKEGKSRFDFSREELYSNIWDFVAENRENFERQVRKLGAGVDWSRFTFTLDEKITKRAFITFKKMWDEDLIYRGERLVNFCTFHGTSFSDIEVVYKEIPGHLWHIKYPLTDGSGSITVATTRPETMLGDTAVAVNPKDERYTSFIGKTIKLPLTSREIPIIADQFVDKDFGTGAVKITPAHDPNDYDMAGRHDLPFISVIDHEGKMTQHVPDAYRGMEVMKARKSVVDNLKKQGFLEKTEDHTHSVGHCYKCDTIIQPLLKDQWFIGMKPIVEPAIKALKDKQIVFYPDSKRKQLIRYLEGLKDWNISRQIAWGIPIPAFQNEENPDDWIYDERVDQEIIEVDRKKYRRDPDVFDTWFSSSSWPYATLDFPDGEDYKKYYPLSVMETGADILYPWVSRMIMFGLYSTGSVPFESVYLHGLIQDEQGMKMSKSKGNVIDPMELIEEYGSDAFRMGIMATESPGNNRPFDRSKMISARNFCNKLWNVARFIEDKLGDDAVFGLKPDPKNIADDWMLSKLQHSIRGVSKLLDQYRFAEAYDHIYHLLWDDLADWYIEASKINVNQSVLSYALETVLKLAHPFAPFVTETIWQTMTGENDDSLLITQAWPTAPKSITKAETFEQIKAIVEEIRYISTTLRFRHANLYHSGVDFLIEHGELIQRLAKLDSVQQVRDGNGLHLTSTDYDCWLDVDQESAKAFIKQLTDNKSEQGRVVERLQARLNNKSYVQNAPKKVVDQTKQQLTEAEALLSKITAEYDRFSAPSS